MQMINGFNNISTLKVTRKLASTFFLLSPFYWVPFVSVEILSGFRAVFLVLISIFTLIIFFKARLVPVSPWFLLGYVVVGSASIFYVLFFPDASLDIVYFLGYSFLFFFFGYVLGSKRMSLFASGRLEVLIALLYFVLCLIMSISPFFPQLNFLNPFYDLNGGFDYRPLLADTGYARGRTAWALAAFFSSMYLVGLAIECQRRSWSLVFYLAAAAGIFSLFVTSGRGGIVYIVVFVIFWWKSESRTEFASYLFFVILLFSIFSGYWFFGEHFRVRGVDDVTSGRMVGYYLWSDLFYNDWLWGTSHQGGYSLKILGLGYSHVHNTWMHLLLMYGSALMLPIYFFVIYVFVRAIKGAEIGSFAYPVKVLLVSGFLSTFLEPGAIISSGHYTLIWWVFLGACLGQKRRTHASAY